MKKIEFEKYFKKVLGGWIGKCFGGAAGAAVEGRKEILNFSFEETFDTNLPNDDLDIQLLWLDVVAEKGDFLNAKDLADAWNKNCWYPFNEYGKFLLNYELGIYPPLSGSFNNPFFKESEGSPIRSEVWGMLFPGNPNKAIHYAELDSSLDHAGMSTIIEKYYSYIESMAFFEDDLNTLIHSGSFILPEKSKAKECFDFILDLTKKSKNWKECIKIFLANYASTDFTDAIVNFGIVLLSLILGEKDIYSTIDIAFRCGYDTDCTCATAGAILGIILGEENLDSKILNLTSDQFICGINIKDQNRSIKELAFKTCCFGIQLDNKLIEFLAIPKIPEKYVIKQKNINDIELEIKYCNLPIISFNDPCEFELIIKNTSNKDISDIIRFYNVPDNWKLDWTQKNIEIFSGEKKCFKNKATIIDSNFVYMKNIINCSFTYMSIDFGIKGCSNFHVTDPYWDILNKMDPPEYPKPHPDSCNLPNLECMVNNDVSLNKEYLEEKNISSNIKKNANNIINSYEDVIPIKNKIKSQYCIYMTQSFEMLKEEKIWIVIGNTDGFKLWINDELVKTVDENRIWTPYNNYFLINLHKGINTLSLKLLRRIEDLKFSYDFRTYEGEHFHKKRSISNIKFIK